LLVVSATAVAAIVVVAPTAIHNRLTFGTFSTFGAPPRVDYCGRRYYPGNPPTTMTRAGVDSFLARNGFRGVTQVDTAPSGLPVVANVMPPDVRERYHTNICTMVVWVQTGPDAYVIYGLSGGP
jgi:hypothetical protein